jgi:hypothetical protein
MKSYKPTQSSAVILCIYSKLNKKIKFNYSLPQSWWINFLKLLYIVDKDVSSSDYIDSLYDETIEIDFSKKSAFELFEFYALLLEFGLYGIGYIFRKEGASKIIKYISGLKKTDLLQMRQLLSASLESNDLDMVGEVLRAMSSKFKDRSDIHTLHLFVKRILPSFDISNIDFSYSNTLDEEFYSLINGKSIAIVGPLKNNSKHNNEIYGFDVIVRFNCKGSEGRTEISYYNGHNADYIVNELEGRVPENLKAVIFKNSTVNDVKGVMCKRRMHNIADYFMLDNAANMLQNTVSDLLLYSPSKIKIFSCNMYISFGHGYDSSYGQTLASDRKNWYPTIGHDPYSQYKFMEFLYKNSLVCGDEEFSDVMMLGVNQYMESLQNQYCAQFLSVGSSMNKEIS